MKTLKFVITLLALLALIAGPANARIDNSDPLGS